MSLPALPIPVRTGLVVGSRASAVVVNGVMYVFMAGHRPIRVALRGDPRDRNLEISSSGVQPPTFTLVAEADTSAGDTGRITVQEDETYECYVFATFSSSRYTGDDQGSIGGVAVRVSDGAGGYGLSDTHDQIKVLSEAEGAASSCYALPLDNDEIDDLVDEIWFFRSMMNPSEVDQDNPPTTLDLAETRSVFFMAARTSIHSLANYDDWVDGETPYVVGQLIKTDAACDANPDSSIYTVRYRCRVAHTGDVGTFSNDYDAGYWEPLGYSPVILAASDADIASEVYQYRAERAVPPPCYSGAIVDGLLCLTGEEPIELDVQVTHGSAVVTITSGSSDVFPDGVAGIGRSFRFYGDDADYSIWTRDSDSQITLGRVFEGATQSGRCVIEGPRGAIYPCEEDDVEIIGTMRPEGFGSRMVAVFDPGSGKHNECIVEAGGIGHVFQRSDWGTFRTPGEKPRHVESVAVCTTGDRGVAVGLGSEVYFVSTDGIRMSQGGSKSQVISDNVKDWWRPTPRSKHIWDLSRLHESVLVFDTANEFLWMFGVPEGGNSVSLGLVCDTRLGAWGAIELWSSDDFVTVVPHITYAECASVRNRHEVFLAGLMRADADADGHLEEAFIGRIWQLEKGHRDLVPRRHGEEFDAISGMSHHSIDYRRLSPPISSDGFERVSVVEVEWIIEPRSNGTTFNVGVEWWPAHGGADPRATALRACLMQRRSGRVSIPGNEGVRVATVVSGTVSGEQDELVLCELAQKINLEGS